MSVSLNFYGHFKRSPARRARKDRERVAALYAKMWEQAAGDPEKEASLLTLGIPRPA